MIMRNISSETLISLLKNLFPKTTEITGVERENLLIMFAMMEPIEESNNQRTITSVYKLGNIEYNVTYGLSDLPIVERIEK